MHGAIGFSSKLHVRDAYLRPTHWKRKFLEKKKSQPSSQRSKVMMRGGGIEAETRDYTTDTDTLDEHNNGVALDGEKERTIGRHTADTCMYEMTRND